MKLAKISALIALVAFAPLTVAADKVAAPPPAAGDPRVAFERYQLPNGLEVILAPDTTVPLVAVNVWYHVGSKNVKPGKTGYAHLFEHLMFNGSENFDDDYFKAILKKIGVDNVNGTTNTDRTNYFEVVPSNQLETAL